MARLISLLPKIFVGLVGITLALILGWWFGQVYGQQKVKTAQAESKAKWDQMTATRLVGIAVGDSFPSFPVWSLDSSGVACEVRELLPDGGLLVSVSPTCHVCVEVAVALQTACDRIQSPTADAVLLLEGESSEVLMAALKEHDVRLPVFWDVEQALFHVHKVNSNPTWFVLNSSGVLKDIGYGLSTADEFVEVLAAK